MNRRLAIRMPEAGLSLGVAALLILFIAYPIGAVLVESTRVSQAMAPERLRAATKAALDLVPEARRASALARWADSANPKERVESLALAFSLAGLAPAWDVAAAFTEQTRAIDSALAALPPPTRQRIEAEYPLAMVMLHRRTALAFQVREPLGPAAFDALRAGVEESRGLDQYQRVLGEKPLRNALLNSLAIASGATILTVALAFAVVFAIHRGGTPKPLVVRSIILLPLVAPPVMVASAIVMLFGRRGLITNTVLDRMLGLINADDAHGYGVVAVLIAQALAFLPAAAIVIDAVLRQQDGAYEEAAANLGASRSAIFRQVTLPLAWPGIKRAILLVFILSLTDFGNPLILGRDIPVAAGVIYDEITAFRNTPLAAAICVLLLVPCLVLFALLERVGRAKRYGGSQRGSGPELALPGAWRLGLTMVSGLVSIAILLVYATVAAGSVTRVWGFDWTLTSGYFGQEGVNIGLIGSGYGSSDRGLALVWQSLEIALWAAPIGGILGMLVAYVVERIRPPGGPALAFLTLVPAILPGLIFGIGYVVAFNVPFGIKDLSLSGTATILVLNIVFSNLFVGMLAARGALQRADASVDEAAQSLGATLSQRLRLVTLPMLRTAFLLGCLYVFVHAMTTLSSVIFLISGDHKLASVAIFNHANSGEFGYAAAKSVVILLLAGSAMLIAWRLERMDRSAAATPGRTTA